MFTWRVRRQLIVLGAIGSIVMGISTLVVVRNLPEPTCFDQKQNQGEFGVDCGGPCSPCELQRPKPVTVFWAKAVPVRENVYDVAALIQNQNEVLSSAEVEYEFILSGEFGEAARRRGRTFLLAQERTMLIEVNIPASHAADRVEFRIIAVEWQFRKDQKPNVLAERREYRVTEEFGKKQSVVEASIVNGTALDLNEVTVQIGIFDEEGNIVGVNRIVIEQVRAGSRRTVRAIWPKEFQGKPASIEMETRVNMFDPEVIVKPR